MPIIVFWSQVVRAFGGETPASFSEVSQFATNLPFTILEYLYTAAYKAWALKSPKGVRKVYKRRGLYQSGGLKPELKKRFETSVSGANKNTIFIHNIYHISSSFQYKLGEGLYPRVS